MWDDLGPPQSTTDLASYFPLFYQSQPLRPVVSTNTILIHSRELRPLPASKPCKTLAMPSILTERRLYVQTARNEKK